MRAAGRRQRRAACAFGAVLALLLGCGGTPPIAYRAFDGEVGYDVVQLGATTYLIRYSGPWSDRANSDLALLRAAELALAEGYPHFRTGVYFHDTATFHVELLSAGPELGEGSYSAQVVRRRIRERYALGNPGGV